MKIIASMWQFALDNPALLVLPACALVITLVLLRLKKRYIEDGFIFGRRATPPPHEPLSTDVLPSQVLGENQVDLEVALRTIHNLAATEDDSGYEYWYEVGRLLKRAATMQAEIDSLRRELLECRARLSKSSS
ncbi:hypothetical protein [Caballeronia sp. BCC1704]|uniref:hypothetical protein n=1 Tax=Caballeronia sp. BCC1704 TaxID=2676300 RepID=UPI001FC8D9C8|nr:hypothetical protein [Caballeronia sp. BCC1704]